MAVKCGKIYITFLADFTFKIVKSVTNNQNPSLLVTPLSPTHSPILTMPALPSRQGEATLLPDCLPGHSPPASVSVLQSSLITWEEGP